MATIINDPRFREFGIEGGARLGEQLGAPLAQLAQSKMQEIQHRQKSRQLMNLGYNAQDAGLLAHFADKPEVMAKVLEGVGMPQNDQLAPIYQQLGTGLPQSNQQGQGMPQQMPQQQMQGQQPGGYQPVYPQQQPGYPQQQGQQQPKGNRPWPGKGGQGAAAEYKQVYQENKQFFDDLRTTYKASTDVVRSAKRALELIRKGRTRSGATGYLGSVLGNKDTRELSTIYETIANDRAAMMRGPISVGKLRAARETKPQLNMPIQAQVDLLENMIKDEQYGPIALKKISDDLYRSNNYKTLPGHEQKARETYDRFYGEGGSAPSGEGTSGDPRQQQAMMQQQGGQPGGEQGQAPQEESENPILKSVRNVIRLGSRGIVEPVVGGVGSLGAFGAFVGNKLLGTPTYEQMQGAIPILPPTSGQVGEWINEKTSGYTAPRGEVEEGLDEIAGTLGALATPTLAKLPLFKALTRAGVPSKINKAIYKGAHVLSPYAPAFTPKTAAKVTGAGMASGKLVELLGGDKTDQMYGKMAGMALYGIRGTAGSLREIKGKIYEETVPGLKNASTVKTGLLNDLEKQANELQASSDPARKAWGKTVEGMWTELGYAADKNDRITLDKLQSRYKDANAIERGLVEKELSSVGDIKETKNILRNHMEKAVDSFGTKTNAVTEWKRANKIYKDVSRLDEAKEFLKNNLSGKGVWSKPLMVLFTDGLGKAAMSYGRLFTNPTIIKLYSTALWAAGKQNKNAFFQSVGRLDAEIRKEMAQGQ